MSAIGTTQNRVISLVRDEVGYHFLGFWTDLRYKLLT